MKITTTGYSEGVVCGYDSLARKNLIRICGSNFNATRVIGDAAILEEQADVSIK
jgi:hypothetical protein